jgi:hypothetical protein
VQPGQRYCTGLFLIKGHALQAILAQARLVTWQGHGTF